MRAQAGVPRFKYYRASILREGWVPQVESVLSERTAEGFDMIKREAKWNTLLNQYLREKKLYCNFELKQTKGNSISFNSVKRLQYEGLMAAEYKGFLWKYSDQDQRQKPFDGSCNPPLPGYVIIKYPKCFVFIEVGKFFVEKTVSDRKSLTYERALEIKERTLVL